MPRSYTAMTTLVTTKLQSAGTADYTVAEVDYQIEDALKEYGTYVPNIVPMVFKIESRYGTDDAGAASTLTDAVKGQFLDTDDNNEKVVHNLTDNSWAVVSSFSSTAAVGLTRNIMANGEEYAIYNKKCWNKRQIYLGDVPENWQVHSVEYPLGTRRNWQRFDDVLEIDVDRVDDSDSTLSTLGNIDVLIRFQKPHILCQLTDFSGTFAATAAAAATSISATALQGAGTIEVGEEFNIQYHKSTYVVAGSVTIASSAATISLYPPLEAAVASTGWTITFRQTTLRPHDEDILADLAAARLSLSKASKYFNSIPIGGGNVWQNFDTWGYRMLQRTLGKLRATAPPKTKKRYPTD